MCLHASTGGRWADLDEDDGEHRQGRGRGQGSVSPGAGIEGQGAPGSGPGGPSSDLSLGADSRGGDDGGVSPRTLLNKWVGAGDDCRCCAGGGLHVLSLEGTCHAPSLPVGHLSA